MITVGPGPFEQHPLPSDCVSVTLQTLDTGRASPGNTSQGACSLVVCLWSVVGSGLEQLLQDTVPWGSASPGQALPGALIAARSSPHCPLGCPEAGLWL